MAALFDPTGICEQKPSEYICIICGILVHLGNCYYPQVWVLVKIADPESSKIAVPWQGSS